MQIYSHTEWILIVHFLWDRQCSSTGETAVNETDKIPHGAYNVVEINIVLKRQIAKRVRKGYVLWKKIKQEEAKDCQG